MQFYNTKSPIIFCLKNIIYKYTFFEAMGFFKHTGILDNCFNAVLKQLTPMVGALCIQLDNLIHNKNNNVS